MLIHLPYSLKLKILDVKNEISIPDTAGNAGLDGHIQVYIGCGHPIQTWAPGHQVNLGGWKNNSLFLDKQLPDLKNIFSTAGRPVQDCLQT
jgi:hypothetical protein